MKNWKGQKIIIKSGEIKQNKTSKQKKKKQISTMAKPKDVRDFLSTSHNNHKETY